MTLPSVLVTRAAHEAGRTLHEPLVEGDPCPECQEPWPCAERTRQRKTIREIVAYLKSDLYERVPLLGDDPPGMRWANPAWSVWMTYGHGSVVLTIRGKDGKPYASTTCADVAYLEEFLP